MIPLSDFEIHGVDTRYRWYDSGHTSGVTIIHKGCGASLGEWDMLDLEDAVSRAVSHICGQRTRRLTSPYRRMRLVRR